jgi:hypothetical protein
MPVSLFVKTMLKKKQLQLSVGLLLLPLIFQAQTLTGLWVGSLNNDSTTVRRDQSFEIALTEYKGKVYGYSRSEFIVNDTLYYVVKRVKGTIDGDVCEVTDDEIISYNFRGKLDKGIKVTSTFRKTGSDSAWHLDGTWKTNATKKYYSVTGKVGLDTEKDLTASKIFPHLEELNLAKDVAFYKDRTEMAPVVKIAKPERNSLSSVVNAVSLTTDAVVAVTPAAPDLQRMESDYVKPIIAPEMKQPSISAGIAKSDIPTAKPGIKQPDLPIAKAAISTSVVNEEPEKEIVVVKNSPPVQTKSTGVSAVNTDTKLVKTSSPTIDKQAATPGVSNAKPVATTTAKAASNDFKIALVVTNTEPKKKAPTAAPEKTNTGITQTAVLKPEVKKPVVDVTLNAAVISGRKSEFSQVVNFKADSLVIALYDNGEIDGDTVSVYMNGEVIMARQGLKASAVRKTIYIQPGKEDFSLVLFADNLGKYPPNTGLLVVYDGDDVYNLRFSSDFQKNAGIVFRRKN